MTFENLPPNVGSNVGITELGRPWQLRSNTTEGTQKQYRKRVGQLLSRCKKEICAKPSAGSYVDWLIAKMPTVLAPTWRQYKAASIFMFHESFLATEGRDEPIKETALAAYWKLSATYHDRDCPKPVVASTSTGKNKRITDKDCARLLAALQKSRSSYGSAAALMFGVTVWVGLRPCEWPNTTLRAEQDGTFSLVVKNAKATNERAHGEYRTLRNVPVPLLTPIRELVQIVSRYADDPDGFASFEKSLQRIVRDTSHRIWPRRKLGYALYCARHEFAARAKLVYSAAEVAALMGHATDETAGKHYGRPTRGAIGGKGFLPEPLAEEVARVRLVAGAKLEKLKNLKPSPEEQVFRQEGAGPMAVEVERDEEDIMRFAPKR